MSCNIAGGGDVRGGGAAQARSVSPTAERIHVLYAGKDLQHVLWKAYFCGHNNTSYRKGRAMAIVLKILLWGILGIVLIIAGCLAMVLVRVPTVSQLEDAVSKKFLIALWNDFGEPGPVQLLCRNDKAGGLAAATFLRDYHGDTNTIRGAKVTITSPTSAESQGHGTAHVSGLVLSRERYNVAREVSLLPNTPPCSGTIAFDYRFYWDDNGRASVWRCAINNVVIIGH